MRITVLIGCILAFAASAVCAGEVTVPVSGKTVDLSGSPVSGVKVFAIMESTGREGWRYVVKSSVLSADDGAFRFALSSLPVPTPWSHCRYYFIAYSPGEWLGWTHGTGQLAPGSDWTGPERDEYKITVSKPVPYEGRIVDEKGGGVPGVRVAIESFLRRGEGSGMNPYGMRPILRIKPAITDRDGRFRLDGVPEGANSAARLEKPGYTREDSAELGADPVVMKLGGAITGRVVDEQGKPVRSARAWAYGPSLVGAALKADGYYRIEGVRPGPYTVAVGVFGKIVRAIKGVSVSAGSTADAPDLVAVKGTWIRGRVLEARTGKPISNAVVSAAEAEQDKGSWGAESEITDKTGAYSVRALPGKVRLSCYAYDEAYESDKSVSGRMVDVPAQGLRNLDLKLVKRRFATGKVVYPNGRPAPGLSVKACTGSGETRAMTDPSGRFKIHLPHEPQQPG